MVSKKERKLTIRCYKVSLQTVFTHSKRFLSSDCLLTTAAVSHLPKTLRVGDGGGEPWRILRFQSKSTQAKVFKILSHPRPVFYAYAFFSLLITSAMTYTVALRVQHCWCLTLPGGICSCQRRQLRRFRVTLTCFCQFWGRQIPKVRQHFIKAIRY